MSLHVVSYSDIGSLSASRQFFAFSEAYLDSAARLCRGLVRSPKKPSYAQGTVVLDLMFHSLELFLKTAILERNPTEQFGGATGHDMEHLSKRYAILYPEKEYAFDMPFKGPDFSAIAPPLDEKTMQYIKEHKKNNPTDQLHRYPRNKKGQPWKVIYAFEPYSCLKDINQLKKDIKRLEEVVFPASPSFHRHRALRDKVARH